MEEGRARGGQQQSNTRPPEEREQTRGPPIIVGAICGWTMPSAWLGQGSAWDDQSAPAVTAPEWRLARAKAPTVLQDRSKKSGHRTKAAVGGVPQGIP